MRDTVSKKEEGQHWAKVLSAKPEDLRFISQPTRWKEKMGMCSLSTHAPVRQGCCGERQEGRLSWESQQLLVGLATTSLFVEYKPGQINEFLEFHRFFTGLRSCDTNDTYLALIT